LRDAVFPISVDQDAIDASRISVTGSPGTAAGHQVFAKVESCGDAIVGLFNATTTLSSSPVTISTTAAKLGLPADSHGYQVQDLWGSQSTVVGGQTTFDISSAGKISATVPPEGVVLYRVTQLS
jgi:alpha-galactosidase